MSHIWKPLISVALALCLLMTGSVSLAAPPKACYGGKPVGSSNGGVPIIFIHGLAGSCDTWKRELQPVDVMAYYFRYDHAGDFTDPRVQRDLDNVVMEMAQLSPTGQVDIVAHSMGGLVARYYLGGPQGLNSHKVRNLVMVGTPNAGSVLAYGIRLSDMIADPTYYRLPKNQVAEGQRLYRQYLKETTKLELLWRKRPTFHRWLYENTNEWNRLSAMSQPITGKWQRTNESREKLPMKGTNPIAPYTQGFERLAALMQGAYLVYTTLGLGVEPVDPIDAPLVWGGIRGLVVHERSMAYDRLLPEHVRIAVGEDKWGSKKLVQVPANPVLLNVNKGNRLRPGTPAQQLVGVATVATDQVDAGIGKVVDHLVGRGVDPSLEVGPGDAIVEVRSVYWGQLIGTDSFYRFNGPAHIFQGEDRTVRAIVDQIRTNRFSVTGVLTLGDQPDSGRRVLDPSASAFRAAIQQHLVEGSNAFAIRYDGEQAALPLQVNLYNPLYQVPLWIYAEHRDRPGHFVVRTIRAPEILTVFDFTRYSRYLVVTREATPLTLEYVYGRPETKDDVGEKAGSQVVGMGYESLLLIDTSGSMREPFQTKSKLEAAQQVAAQLVALRSSRGDSDAQGSTPGLIAFSSGAQLLAPPGTDVERLQQLISTLAPEGGTNIGAAIQLGIDRLSRGASGDLLLLTDGLPQTGLTANQILADLVPMAIARGVSIHAIGFGEPGQVDEQFLASLADSTGGQYTFATSPFQLANQAIHTYHLTVGAPVASFSGRVAQGETVIAGTLPIHGRVSAVNVTLNWPGSDMDLILIDPAGREVKAGYPGATVDMKGRPRFLRMTRPVPGTWNVLVRGTDLPHGPEPFEIQVSAELSGPVVTGMPFVAGFWFLLSALTFIAALVTLSDPRHPETS